MKIQTQPKIRAKKRDRQLFDSPFHVSFWKLAAKEFSYIEMIAVAAMFIALRIAVKSLTIPLTAGLKFSFDFLVNSVGSMIYGPLVGLAVGAVSDTVGYLLFPSGVYFFPFIFVEMSSSFLFGLFFYRARLTQTRIILSRLTVTVFCNLLLTPALMKWEMALGIYPKPYRFFVLSRVIKNICEFPFQSVILIFWLGSISAVTRRMELTFADGEKMKPTKKNLLFLIGITAAAILAVGLYILYKHHSSS